MHNKKLFYIWMAFCAIVGIVFWAIAFWLIGTAVFAHEIEHKHPEAIPSPPPNEAIVRCLDEYDPFAHHNSTRRDQFEILKQCVINADKERQYQDAIKMFMAQRGVQM